MSWIEEQMAPQAMLSEEQKNKINRFSGFPSPSRQMYMRRIGVFKLVNGEYVGRIATLNFRCEATISDNPYRTSPSEPDYIVRHSSADVFAADLGYAWEKITSEQNVPYLLVHLDDPSFPRTVTGALVHAFDNVYNLFWDRVTISEEDIESQRVHEELQVYIGDLTSLKNPPKQFLINMYEHLKEVWDPEPD
jgi:uncharacterized protein (DUF736 family)